MGNLEFSFPVSHEPLDECGIGAKKCQMILYLWPSMTAFIWIFLYLPFVIYHVREYRKHSDHIVYTNRYSSIVLVEVKVFLFQLLLALNNIFAVIYVDQVQPLYVIYVSLEASVSIYLYYLWVWRYVHMYKYICYCCLLTTL